MSKTTAKKATAGKAVAKKAAAKTTKRTTRKAAAARKTTRPSAAPARRAAKKPSAATARTAARRPAPRTTPATKAGTPRLPADLKLAISSALDKQAIDLTVLDLRNASAFTDFFVICTGANTKQVQAIADAVVSGLKTRGESPALVEGYARGEWVLIDYFTFIVHVFLPAQRRFYDLERLWGGAEPIEISAS